MNKSIEIKVFDIYIKYVASSNRQVGRGKPLLCSSNVFHLFAEKPNLRNKKIHLYSFFINYKTRAE